MIRFLVPIFPKSKRRAAQKYEARCGTGKKFKSVAQNKAQLYHDGMSLKPPLSHMKLTTKRAAAMGVASMVHGLVSFRQRNMSDRNTM